MGNPQLGIRDSEFDLSPFLTRIGVLVEGVDTHPTRCIWGTFSSTPVTVSSSTLSVCLIHHIYGTEKNFSLFLSLLSVMALTKVRFSNLGKILYPSGITKKQVIEYYIKIAPRILSFLFERPLVLNRFPNGIAAPGFYGKDAPKGTPDWVSTFRHYSESAERVIDYILCNDLDTLLWVANLAALELHIPLSRAHSLDNPDLIFLDLDPEPPAGLSETCVVALLLKEKLELLGLNAYVKTSGKKGLHVLIPILPKYTFNQTRTFVHQLGLLLAKESDLVVSERSQTHDPGTVLIDYPQNSRGRTLICPYSLRATPQAPVSTPLHWKEVKELIPDLTIFTVISRTNPWTHFWDEQQMMVGFNSG